MTDIEQEVTSLLRDMNGNVLREGDLVMVILEKPVLVGFITKINTPSIITGANKSQPGIMSVAGTVSIPFNPRQVNLLQQTAKLVDPRAETLVNAIADSVRRGRADVKLPETESGTEGVKATGPTLVSSATAPQDVKE